MILNTNYHELVINFSDSRLYDELHGNYMFKINTNYHELVINFSDSRLYDKLHGNYMFKINTNYHELNTNFSLMIIVVMGTGSWVYNSTEGGASATADGTALPLFSNRRKRAAD